MGWTLPAAPGERRPVEGAVRVRSVLTPHKAEVPLPPGQWKLLSDGISSSLWRGESAHFQGRCTLAGYSATILGLL